MSLNLDHEDLYPAHDHDPSGLSNETLTVLFYIPTCYLSALELHYPHLCYRDIQASPSLFLEILPDMCSCYLVCHGSYLHPLAPCRHT